MAPPGGHMFYIGLLYREQHKKFLVWNQKA